MMVENLRDIINIFHEATRMKLNIKKSTISYWGISKTAKYLCSQVFPFQALVTDVGLKYLGFQLKENWYQKGDC
jgi:hypothetical protein